MASNQGLPLDKKELINGSATVPALHQKWVSKSCFVAYVAPPSMSDDAGLMGEWLERLRYIAADLHWLLQLSHHKFWCQVIFDESLHHMLDSFLRHCPRPYDSQSASSNNSDHDTVTKLVFFTYLRMATYKESKENWISPEVFGDIIYENFLFDMPKLLDLCALYGHANTTLLSKMVTNIFTQQPKYWDDLRAAMPTILQVFTNIAIQCGLESEAPGLAPQRLEEGGQGESRLVTMGTGELGDVVYCLADAATTLSAFLTVHPPAAALFHSHDLCTQLAHVYEKLVPAFSFAIKHRQFENAREKRQVGVRLRQARQQLLTAFHLVVSNTCLQPVLDSISQEDSSRGEVDRHVEDFLAIMAAVLGEKRFLADYEGQFSFQDSMDILSQAAGTVDETHYRYIQEAINAAFAAHGRRRTPKGDTNRGGRTSPDGCPFPTAAQSSTVAIHQPYGGQHSTAVSHHAQGAEAVRVTGVELDSLVCAVQDLLPHLETVFIRAALEELGYSVEAVVGAVLEDRLPERLANINLDSHCPAEPEETAAPLMVESRRNIYDNDQFDVFNNPTVDLHNVHKGKREVEASVLEDKSQLGGLRDLYSAYGSMDVPSMYDKQVYDDEYDDTYDTNNVGADDADSADELTQRRPFTVPQVLRRKTGKQQSESEESSEEDAAPRDQFVPDPSKLREQQAQRRGTRPHGHAPPRDVKGKAKGQGQTEEVVRNRRFKEKNKGVRANHNRRAMADRKQGKGMF